MEAFSSLVLVAPLCCVTCMLACWSHASVIVVVGGGGGRVLQEAVARTKKSPHPVLSTPPIPDQQAPISLLEITQNLAQKTSLDTKVYQKATQTLLKKTPIPPPHPAAAKNTTFLTKKTPPVSYQKTPQTPQTFGQPCHSHTKNLAPSHN